jgi:putative toxin-antitoxin system antitoxin component (TIGR02293 family)
MAVTSVKQADSGAIKLLLKYEPYFRNSISLLGKAKKGLDAKAVFEFVSLSHLSQDMVESVLSKSMKTFQNYQGKKTLLDAPTSEKLLKLFALYNKGAEVFGSVDAFSEWLSKPAYGIGNKVPQDIMDTMTGLELINEELVRISYGDLA